VALFPLLLIFVTILDITLKDNPDLQQSLLNSALAQYPVIGDQIKNNLGEVSGTGFQLGVGIAVLLLGTRGIAFAMQNALCNVWGIARHQRPNFAKRTLYGLALVVATGVGLVVTSFLSGIAGGAGNLISGFVAFLGAVAVSLILNVGLFWLGFRLATMRMVRWRNLWLGAVLAAIIWQVLQVFGGYVVTHTLHRSSNLYGTFGIVLGLLGWLYLQATVTLYCAEVDAVLAKAHWPRSLLSDGPPPEGAIRPHAAARHAALPKRVVPGQAVPERAVPEGPVSEQQPVPEGAVPEGPAPRVAVQATQVRTDHAREDHTEADGDGDRSGASQNEPRERGSKP
jgi:YihY family inner membrane protein